MLFHTLVYEDSPAIHPLEWDKGGVCPYTARQCLAVGGMAGMFYSQYVLAALVHIVPISTGFEESNEQKPNVLICD